jgi:DNA-binding CsgD family transcriptional regulator
VCWRLGNGDSVEQIADELGVSRETVRSQLKRVFAKTGTHRQAELLRLVLAGPVSWLPID